MLELRYRAGFRLIQLLIRRTPLTVREHRRNHRELEASARTRSERVVIDFNLSTHATVRLMPLAQTLRAAIDKCSKTGVSTRLLIAESAP